MSSANEFCRPSSEPIALRNVLKCPTRHTLHNIIRFWHFSSLLSLQKTPKTQFYATVLRTVSPLFTAVVTNSFTAKFNDNSRT